MLEADAHSSDLGRGAGERGGEIVFYGTPGEIRLSAHFAHGQYLAAEDGRPVTGRAADGARAAQA